jgi:NAD(P)-dependent dehydrogenase (short-subunit alcohol dehydrogenase family)
MACSIHSKPVKVRRLNESSYVTGTDIVVDGGMKVW